MQIAILCINIISENECKNIAQNYEYAQKTIFSDLVKENKEFVLLDFDNHSDSWTIANIQRLLPQFSGLVVFIKNKESAKIQSVIGFLGQLLRDKMPCIFFTENHNTLIGKVLNRFPSDTVQHGLEENSQKECIIQFRNKLFTKKNASI